MRRQCTGIVGINRVIFMHMYIEGEAIGVVVCGTRSLQCFIDNELYLDRKNCNRTSVCGMDSYHLRGVIPEIRSNNYLVMVAIIHSTESITQMCKLASSSFITFESGSRSLFTSCFKLGASYF